MEETFHKFQKLKEKHLIQAINPYFNDIIYEFSFLLLNEQNNFQFHSFTNIWKSFIAIDECIYLARKYYIISFERTVILIDKKNIEKVRNFIKENKDSIFIFFQEKTVIIIAKDFIREDWFQFFSPEIGIQEEIEVFQKEFLINNREILPLWKKLTRSMCYILYQEGLNNSDTDRIMHIDEIMDESPKYIEMNDQEYFKTKTIKMTTTSIIEKIYHLKERKFFVIKKKTKSFERRKLYEREYSNYLKVHHPFLLQFYIDSNESRREKNEQMILEYVNDSSLENIKEKKLTDYEKVKIIFELMIIINYLHENGFIYRDLKPNNIIIDSNKTVILIDLDRMIEYKEVENESENNEEHTIIIHHYSSPEIENNQKVSYSSDIYSLGKVIYYILFEEEPSIANIEKRQLNKEKKYESIIEMINNCINEDPKQRPKINEIIKNFYLRFYSKSIILKDDSIQKINVCKKEYTKYLVYLAECEFPYLLANKIKQKETLSLKNGAKSYVILGDYFLGFIDNEGKFSPHDINKTIDYLTLSANLNNPDAQYLLGCIYFEGEYISKDISKAIHYLTLSANQNNEKAQYYLGAIYYEGVYVMRDINKSIDYLTSAANKNNAKAQCSLGYIYFEEKYVSQDINKAIHYLTLSANQNCPSAQFLLGCIYFEGEYISRDINKAIHYLTLSANQNNEKAQYYLGAIYYEGVYVGEILTNQLIF